MVAIVCRRRIHAHLSLLSVIAVVAAAALSAITSSSNNQAHAFIPSGRSSPSAADRRTAGAVQVVLLASKDDGDEGDADTTKPINVVMPLTWDEMIRQTASTIKQAAKNGQNKQIIRILLPRDAANADFGIFQESETSGSGRQMSVAQQLLVPPDESWQGGIMQLYRAAAPTAEQLLRQLTQDAGLPPRINEDRSIDESGVDGIGCFTTDDNSVTCYVQPTQEIIDEVIVQSSNTDDNNLVLLLNPQWRQVDDALDTASKRDDGFLSNLASFLGGKGGTLKQLSEAGFIPTYTLEGYVCRGANVRLLQISQDMDWTVFCEDDTTENERFVQVGTSPTRPTYQTVDEMLQKADIGFKFARDFQPKA